MPRSTEEILAHAEVLARQFEDYEPTPGDRGKMSPELRLRLAAMKRAEIEIEVNAAVSEARRQGLSWAKVGKALGTSGQAASERYSTRASMT